jgi:phosphoribosylglycinamide formyltransferase-1
MLMTAEMSEASARDSATKLRAARVSLITYDAPHKKTQDILFRLLVQGRFELTLTLVPFKSRPQRATAFQHRPAQLVGPDPRTLAKQYKLETFALDDWRSFEQRIDYFLICGAGLIDGSFCASAQIINCHPGLIPQSRGLDAFKWCIYKGWRLGNTLHRIDRGVDLGTILHHLPTDVFEEDDLAALAIRHYQAEIDLLANFDRYLMGGTVLSFDQQEPTKRMPAALEPEMMRSFENFKRRFAAGAEAPSPAINATKTGVYGQ